MDFQSIEFLVFLPFLGFVITGLFGRFLGRNATVLVSVSIGLGTFVSALFRFFEMYQTKNKILSKNLYEWIRIHEFSLQFNLQIDQLSGIILLFITGAGFCILIYAVDYVKGSHVGYQYLSSLHLLTASVILAILADNFLVMIMGWEGASIAAFLLIGFNHHQSRKKHFILKNSFILSNITDFGLILGVLLIISQIETLTFSEIAPELKKSIQAGNTSTEMAKTISILFLISIFGKSLLFPFHHWIVRASHAYTPGITFLQAIALPSLGIYLACRLSAFFSLDGMNYAIFAIVGGVTMLVTALFAMVQKDLRKILALSTSSQIGYCFLAIGTGEFSAGVFHLITHGLAKTLLLLLLGWYTHPLWFQSAQTAKHPRDLSKFLWFGFLVGAWNLVGLPLGSTYFSQQEIFWKVFNSSQQVLFLWFLGILTVGLTSFYVYRGMKVFFYQAEIEKAKKIKNKFKFPWKIKLVSTLLMLLTVASGFLAIPSIFSDFIPIAFPNFLNLYFHQFFLSTTKIAGSLSTTSQEWLSFSICLASVLWGVFLARELYSKHSDFPKKMVEKFPRIYRFLKYQGYLENIIWKTIVLPILNITKFNFKKPINSTLSSTEDFLIQTLHLIGHAPRILQTGKTQHYLFLAFLVLVFVLQFSF
ncbi:MAG: NADH-quinone oxidoreductase subunit L [bacterium]|jgi:NADH-quinone oxidoreductase subunit L